MKVSTGLLFLVMVAGGCGSKDESAGDRPVEKVREAVKDVVTQDFKALEGAKDSLKQSGEKTKAALEAVEKDLN